MLRRRFFAWLLILANILVQMPSSPSINRAAASNAAQNLSSASSQTVALSPASGRLSTPYPVIRPVRPLGPPVVVQAVDARVVGQRIAGMSYARVAQKRHLAPESLALAGAKPSSTSAQNAISRLGTPSRTQTLGTRSPSAASIRPMTVTTGTADPDGINHWWTYEEDALGGVGKYMINVASGNLITQSDDLAVPNKGIEFAFRRTYNSMSNHTYANTDGSTPALYGDKWTNTFDAHIAYNDFSPVNGQKGVSLYDIDGARYDYAPVGDGHSFTAPAGQFNVLYYDGTGYSWTKKSGTVYYFWDVNQPSNQAGLAGQIEIIYARNHNNYLSFARSYSNNDESKAINLTSMVVTAEDGRAATLTFGDVSQNGSPNYRVLQAITWPDGTTTTTYGYTVQFQGQTPVGPALTQVTKPGNGSTTSGKLNEQYNYASGTAILTNVFSPRYYCSHNGDCTTASNPILTGPAYSFSYNASNELSQVGYFGNVNPSFTDVSGTGYLQPSSTHDLGTSSAYRTVSLSYVTGSTTWSDTDGHNTTYGFDSIGRVTRTTETTGDPSGGAATLVTAAGWDTQNYLLFTTDPRANETDYAFDNNGNAIAVGQPSSPTNVNGSIVSLRATSLYSYDTNNNVTAYCDPVWSHANGRDWVTRPAPSDSLCPTQAGTTQMAWASTIQEPFGELASITTPLGYQRSFSYDTSKQGGADYGLPTAVLGVPFTELNGSRITPTQQFTYDRSGNLICFFNGVGTWALSYDNLSRNVQIADPDDGSSLSTTACGKTSNSNTIITTKTFLPNGSTATNQTPSEASQGLAAQFGYDSDGNKISETEHYGGFAGTTSNIYDGADRLVEVQDPHDPTDLFAFPFVKRYEYDLSMGGSVIIGDSTYGMATVKAFGGLYQTQEYLASAIQHGDAPGTPPPTGSWLNISGAAFDALDRTTTKYSYQPGANLQASSNAYDATSDSLGFLSNTTNPVGDKQTVDYDAVGRVIVRTFTVDPSHISQPTPTRTYQFDADGRVVAILTAELGTEKYSYDADGRLASKNEPPGGTGMPLLGSFVNPTSPASLSYSYYPNGWRSALSVSSSALSQTNVIAYSYQTDGLDAAKTLTYGNHAYQFAWTHTLGGRLSSRSDPYYSAVESNSYDSYGQLSNKTIPSGVYTTITHEPEGSVAGFVVTGHLPVSNKYNVRGEFVTPYATSTPLNGYRSANGFNYPTDSSCTLMRGRYEFNGTQVTNFDARLAAPLGTTCFATPPPSPAPTPSVVTISYDAAGRQTGTTPCYCDMREYDVENHVVAHDHMGFAWGQNGHPVIKQYYGVSPITLHWDADQLLFSTTSSGQLNDLKFEDIGDIQPLDSQYAGLTLWDRSLAGNYVLAHNATGYGYWVETLYAYPGSLSIVLSSPTAGYKAPAAVPTASTAYCNAVPTYSTSLEFYYRSDGISDGCSVIQGVREYSTTTATWTTPDAYAGEINDPLSQKPYMWNRNNPVTYSDPSGYCIGPLAVICIWFMAGGGALTLTELSIGASEGAGGGGYGGLGNVGLSSAERVAANRAFGLSVQRSMQLASGGTSKGFSTSIGWRFVDSFFGRTAQEIKTGYVSMSPRIAGQISKDAELVSTGQVGRVEWVFQPGINGQVGVAKSVLNFLRQAGIDAINGRTGEIMNPK
jgi:YD repeat-containing protein